MNLRTLPILRFSLICLILAQALTGCAPAAALPAPIPTAAPIPATRTPASTATTAPLPPTAIPSPTANQGIITPANAADLVELRQLGLGSLTGAPLYTPDGRWLLLPTAAGIYRFDTSGYQKFQRIIPVPAFQPVAIAPDGQALAVGRRVFDISGEEGRELTGAEPNLPEQFKDKGLALVARFSPDGQGLGLIYYDQQLGIFARADGRLLYTLTGNSLEPSPDGRYLVTQEKRKEVQHVVLYDAATGKLLRDWTAERARFIDNDRLAIESGAAVHIYDLPDLRAVQALDGRFASFSPDGGLAAVFFTNELRLLRVTDRAVLARIPVDLKAIDEASLTFSPDGQTLSMAATQYGCCGGYDTRQALYRVPDGQVILQSTGKPQTFSPDGQAIVIADPSGGVQIHNTKDGAQIASIGELNGSVIGLAFIGDGPELVAATYGNGAPKLLFYQPESGKLLKEQPTNINAYDYGLAASPDGKLVSLAGEIWQTATMEVLQGVTMKMVDHSHTAAHGLAFSPDSTRIAVGQLSGHLEVWDVPTESLVMEDAVCGEYDIVSSLAFSPDGKRLAVACTNVMGDSTPGIQIWQPIPQGKRLAELSAQQGGFGRVAYSRDGRVLAAAGTAAGAWDAASGDLLLTVPSKEDLFQNKAESLALTPDGQLMAIGYTDGSVDLWSVMDGQKIVTLPYGDHNPARALAFSPEGKLLVVGLDDGSMRVWGIK